MKINKMISKYNQESRYGQTVKFIVIHYVGAVSSAKNNCIYFCGGNRRASAHYFVDSEIWQCIPESKTAWHCGGGLLDTGRAMNQGNRGATYFHVCTNYNSIGIELCCYKKNGMVVPTPTAIETAAPLVKHLMKKYNVPASHVIRHFDVNGKICPNGYISAKAWAVLHKKLTGSSSSGSSSSKTSSSSKKSTTEIAKEVIAGKWGNGTERKQKLTAAGYDYAAVQEKVNQLLK
ncbi:N-acetylmuramoyl-L-alanine amidase [Eubacterium sp. F2]|jgi:N-acetylmuramoyl-L-alanine amidase CwlA|uniref:N-acetylmuramoyl-L-alanine amidase n=1 Tax=Eubacterium sp. F2 TaxID=3381348 RepID=UPI0039083E12